MAVGGKKRKVKLKVNACMLVRGPKTFDGEAWHHHDYEICANKEGLTMRRIGTFPEDSEEPKP